MFTFDSSKIYTDLVNAQAQLNSELQSRTGNPDAKVRIVYWGHSHSDAQFELTFQTEKYGSPLEVKGKHLQQLFEEGLRRLGFAQQQESLQLTHEVEAEIVEPEVDEETGMDSKAAAAAAVDDEIPF